jgi:cell division protein FtsL
MAAPLRKAPVQAASPRAGKGKAYAKNSGRKRWQEVSLDAAALKRAVSLLLPFAVLLFLALFLIWERVKVNELAAQIAVLEAQRSQLADQNGKLHIQVEQLSGFGRISRLATQRLGLIMAPQQLIVVDEE